MTTEAARRSWTSCCWSRLASAVMLSRRALRLRPLSKRRQVSIALDIIEREEQEISVRTAQFGGSEFFVADETRIKSREVLRKSLGHGTHTRARFRPGDLDNKREIGRPVCGVCAGGSTT